MNDLRNTLLDDIEEQERKLKKSKVRILNINYIVLLMSIEIIYMKII